MENGEMSNDAGACRVLNKEVLSKGRWVALNEITYTDPSGKERKWESAERTTKISGESDGVVIIPVLKRLLKYDCVVLVKQFRPPVGTVTIEFPAGLIDRGESAQECAVRELKEETGFTGVVKHISPCTTIDPGLSNCTVKMVTMEIDGDLAENYHPRKHLEFIEVVQIPIDTLLDRLNTLLNNGVIVHSIVYTYAIACAQTAKPKIVIP
ncbi:hypothetical protein C0Q70_15372 [Pomacea canaliculata]|uniref:ADP-sugar pyrophosphatase n=1 Tax=Pomacea canaliculata TaxID=400727 RepID=A0A2T7NUP6_POMCA|nr:hypothetical protein C0Q70_15372 [Pomacea canaliculata]